MPADTPLHGFPYPLGTDPINPAADMRALAEAVDADLGITRIFATGADLLAWLPADGATAFDLEYGARFIRNRGEWITLDVTFIPDARGGPVSTSSNQTWLMNSAGTDNLRINLFPGFWLVSAACDVSVASGGGWGYFDLRIALYPDGLVSQSTLKWGREFEFAGINRFNATTIAVLDARNLNGLTEVSALANTFGGTAQINESVMSAVKVGAPRPGTFIVGDPLDMPFTPSPPEESLDQRVAELEEFNAALLAALGSILDPDDPANASTLTTLMAHPAAPPKGKKAK